MANQYSGSFQVQGSSVLTDIGRVIHSPVSPVQIGSDGFDSIKIELDDGTGDQQANQHYCEQRAILANSNLDLNLYNVLTNGLNQTIKFICIKAVIISIVSADGVKRLLVGPQAVSGGAQLWFNGTGSDAAESVYDYVHRVNSWSGWAVSSSSPILRLRNPTASDLVCNILIVGCQQSSSSSS